VNNYRKIVPFNICGTFPATRLAEALVKAEGGNPGFLVSLDLPLWSFDKTNPTDYNAAVLKTT
jgi:hypothetical protein